MTRKILALITDAYGSYGGIARYNTDLLEALAHNSKVTVIARIGSRGDQPRSSNLKIVGPFENKFIFSAISFFTAVMVRPDIIYCGHLYHGPLARILSKVFRTRLVSQLHGTEVWEPLASRHLKPLETSDLVLCVSRDTKSRYLAQAQAKADNARVVYNTVGEAFIADGRQAAREYFKCADRFIILTVARLDARWGGYKGHELVIRALSEMEPSSQRPHYWIAGVGNDRQRLERLCEELGVSDRVRFLGKVPQDALPSLYRAADLFALPSTAEGFGIAFIEAMASGTPAIGLAVGGATDALDGERWAFQSSQSDFPSVLDKAIGLSSAMTDEERQQLSERATAKFGKAAFHASASSAFDSLL